MIRARSPRATGRLLAVALAAALPSTGCAFAVDHPAVTAGVVAGALGFGTCKLASDNYGACFEVAGGAGAFLGLVAATALWLGGDGHTVMTEQQAQPLPEDGRPRRRRQRPAAPPAAEPAGAGSAAPVDEPPSAGEVPVVPVVPAPPPASPSGP